MNNLLSQLNENQIKAVQTTEGPVLVIAGAGAGKTRVITYRIAYLIKECGILPHNILAVTFTNKAANEMKNRIYDLIGPEAKKVWMGTFHSVGLNILRRFAEKTPVGVGFGIIDQDDRLRVVKEVVKELGIDNKKYSPKNYLSFISDYKNSIFFVENKAPEELTHRFPEVFSRYQEILLQQRLIDYDDMLSLSLRLLLYNKDILNYYRSLCKYIMVDEYQDTNVIQFAFIRELAGVNGNVCVVGDDDQSIYGWRGAEIGNILYFDNHFSNVKEIKLTDNYRSAPQILEVANNLISKNSARRGKDLVAQSPRVGEVVITRLLDETAEADFVIKTIEEQLLEGVPQSEIAILYRTNAQSRNFEVMLNRKKVPYKVIGGVGFYQRREIKDVLSYLRVYDNPYDEASFFRLAKTPPKGVGDVLLEKIREYTLLHHIDFISAAELMIPTLPKKQANGLSVIRNIMHNLVTCSKISEMINMIIEDTEYKAYLLQSEDAEEAKLRTENIYELYNSAILYEEQFPEGTLSDFLAVVTLVTSSDESAQNSVSLMTMHAAKGLEFESVFLTGMEDGIFPLSPQEEDHDLEEERRLCYVGITRAKVSLNMTFASSRMIHGKRQSMPSSRFIKEIAITPFEKKGMVYAAADGGFHKGQQVTHELFGDGIVMQINGSGESAKIDVLFKKHGLKKLVARFLRAN